MAFTPPAPDQIESTSGFKPPKPDEIEQPGQGKEQPLHELNIWEQLNLPFHKMLPEKWQQRAGELLTNPVTTGTQPIIDIASAINPKLGKTVSGIARGGAEAEAEAASSFETPLGIATLGMNALPKLAQRGISAAFAIQMAKNLPEQWEQLKEGVKKGDAKEITKSIAGTGLDATMAIAAARHAIAREPKPPTPPPKQIKGLLNAPASTVLATGEIIPAEQWANMTDTEKNAARKTAESIADKRRKVNTISAALAKGDTPAKWEFKEQGANWYKQDGIWRTDKPTKSFNVSSLDPQNPAHAQVIAKLEHRLQTRAARVEAKPTETQQKIEEITGVSRMPASIMEVAPELTMREIWEKEENQRFAVPLRDYGPPRGPLSMTQQDYLKAFANYMKTGDLGKIRRLYETLTGGRVRMVKKPGERFATPQRYQTPPQNAFERTVLSMLRQRLGIPEVPEPQTQIGGKALKQLTEGGEENATGKGKEQVNIPPQRGGNGEGGPPAGSGAGGELQRAEEVPAQAPKKTVNELFDEEKSLREALDRYEGTPEGHNALVKKLTEARVKLADTLRKEASRMRSENEAAESQLPETKVTDDAARLEELKQLDNPTPEQEQERDALQKKSDAVRLSMKSQAELAKARQGAPWAELAATSPADFNSKLKAAGLNATTAGYDLATKITSEDIPKLEAERDSARATFRSGDKTDMGQKSQMFDEAVRMRRAMDEAISTGATTDEQLTAIAQKHGVGVGEAGDLKAALKSTAKKSSLPKEIHESTGGEPPHVGPYRLFSKDWLGNRGMTQEQVIAEWNRLAETRNRQDMLQWLKDHEGYRDPRAALSALSRDLQGRTRSREELVESEQQTKLPLEEVATEEQKVLAERNKATAAYRNYRAALNKWRNDFIRNYGRIPNDAEIKDFKRDNPDHKYLLEWQQRTGAYTIDADKWYARTGGIEPIRVEEKPRSPLNPGDKVIRTAPDGTIEEGEVRAEGSSLGVFDLKTGRAYGPDLSQWQKDTRPAPAAREHKPLDETGFEKSLLDAKPLGKAVLKSPTMRAGMKAALDKAAPGLFKRSLDAVNDLRKWMAARGVDPDVPGQDPGHDAIKYIVESLNEAGREAYRQRETPGPRSSLIDVVDRAIANAQKLKDPTFREQAENIAKKLDNIRANPPKPGDVNLKLQPFEFRQLWNDAIGAAQSVIRAGGSTLDAIAAAVRHVREIMGKAWNDFNFRDAMQKAFGRPDTGEPPPPKDFLKTWINDSLAPALGRGYDTGKSAINLMVDWFAPTVKAHPGDLNTLMEAKGFKDKLMLRAAYALSGAKDMMAKLPRNEQIDFIDRVKRGIKQPTEELQKVADLIREWDDRLYALASKYSPDLPYLANHLRVLWKVIPGTAGMTKYQIEQIMAKRPWRGSRGFLLRHTLEDMSEGIAKGGVPLTYNPIEMFLLHAQDVSKFVSANRTWENLKDSGRAVYVERGDFPPDESWGKINDTIAKQYFKRVETTPEGQRKVTKPGDWYVDRNTARLINNYLSRDFIRENGVGRGLLNLKNMSTAIELGASPFHAAFVTLESMGSSLGLAAKKAFSGDFRGAGSSLVDAASAILGPRSRMAELGRVAGAYARSPKEFKSQFPEIYEWFQKKYPQFDKMINDLFTSGGMVDMHEDYKIKSAKGFQEALANNNYLAAAWKAIPAANQWILKPIFQEYIPRLKLGHFLQEYGFELERQAKDLESGKITRGELGRKVWAFVDDRFGELNYDNLYWDRTFKTAQQLMFRSVTWKLGNLRGFGKAVRDIGLEATAPAREGRLPRLTMPMAWLFGMAFTTTLISSIVSKIFTKKYPWEMAQDGGELAKNLVFPRVDATDPSQRVSTPTYWKDMVHFLHSPTDYVRSSMSGEIGRAIDVWDNKDFYGTQVYNPDDPFWKRQEDKALHMIPLPFSISSQLAAERSGASKTVSHLGQAGFTKSPYFMSHTPAELKASELMQQALPQGARTRENAEKSINVHKSVQAIKRGDMTIQEAEKEGLIDPKKYKQAYQMVHQSYLVTQIKRSSMTPDDAMKVWALATPQEKKEIHNAIELKIIHSRSLTPQHKSELLRQLRAENP